MLRSVAALSRAHVATVFIGGGTPTLLPAADISRVVARIASEFELDPGAEVTVEANPETVDAEYLAVLRAGGVTRLSIGMQSARANVLAALGRAHTPGRAAAAVAWARRVGFEHVSVDLIYGAPGESDADWAESLDTAAAAAAEVDHVSAYSLKIEQGTSMAAAVRRGLIAQPDPDLLARKYEVAEARLSAAGFDWYEISNWSRAGGQCQHNLGYWRGHDWLGVGPGAHSHVAGVRWWNDKLPARCADQVASGRLPIESGEVLDDASRRVEAVMLGIRLADGLSVRGPERKVAEQLVKEGLVEPSCVRAGRAVLTTRGRLLADLVTRRILDAGAH